MSLTKNNEILKRAKRLKGTKIGIYQYRDPRRKKVGAVKIGRKQNTNDVKSS